MKDHLKIGDRRVGPEEPVYIVAEMSANHHQDFDEARRIIETAAEAGADAVKLQTYTPDTMTLDLEASPFVIGEGTIWEGKTLYELYKEAYTPWEWQPDLKAYAEERGLQLFSTPFDATAVDFLEEMDAPAHKIASFENVDIPLIRRVARTGKPIIMSTGMADLADLGEAVDAVRAEGVEQLALLKCTSAYPAPTGQMNLRTIPHLAKAFQVPAGLSDHTLGTAVPVAAVTLGACIVEKHLTMSREVEGPDSAFSLEPQEFSRLVDDIRVTEKALGEVSYELTEQEKASTAFRRSLFVVKDIGKGETLDRDNVRSIRPGDGLAPKYMDVVLGRRAQEEIERGTPLDWSLIG
jgi:N-acetylneuraminate synthase